MKKIYYTICALLMHIAPGLAHPESYDPLSELSMPESKFVLKIDTGILDICRMLIQEWKSNNMFYCNDDLAELLNNTSDEIDVETALRALHYCIHEKGESDTLQTIALRETLADIHNQIADRYNAILTESGSRRIKIKFYNKVTSGELIVNDKAYIQDLTVKKNLILNAASGALISTNGLITSGQIPASAIPAGSITNAQLSNTVPVINSTNIAPMTITPDLLAFNMVQAFSGEPTPLAIYRGSVNGTTGAGSAGFGFSSTRTGTGAYTIDINGPSYTDVTSYQVFIQLLSSTDPVTITNVSATRFTINTVTDHDFSFFTIGN